MTSPGTAAEFSFLRFDDMDSAALYALLKLRFDVFILEQQSLYPELDGKDPAALHCVHLIGGAPVATLRILDEGDIHIGRVAVRGDLRGGGLARRMMTAALQRIAADWPGRRVVLGAQHHLRPFYADFGFTQCSDVYDDGGIPHIDMERAA